MFLMAFERDIKKEIRECVDERFPFPDYFGYFLFSKIIFDPEMSRIYLADYEARSRCVVTCQNCGKSQSYDDIHPSLMGRTRIVLPLCNSCWFWLSEFTDLSAVSKIPADFKNWFSSLKTEQECPICKKRFVWLRKAIQPTYEVPFIPGRFVQICPDCVYKALLQSNNQDDFNTNLRRFKFIADTIGGIPDKSGFVYNQVDSLDVAITLTKEMQKMPTFSDLSKSCGSWFKLLIASGVLPEGVRQLKYGTMVLAKDGHECLSLAEKEIDDMLFSNGISHQREPIYPDSNFKADWLITVKGEHILIEFFGLYGEKHYMKRMEEKLEYALGIGLKVIAFLPKDMNNLRQAFSSKVLSLFES